MKVKILQIHKNDAKYQKPGLIGKIGDLISDDCIWDNLGPGKFHAATIVIDEVSHYFHAVKYRLIKEKSCVQ